MYDYLIVGAGLFGSMCAYLIQQYCPESKVLVVDKRNHVGGTCYTKDILGINVHMYGAHIFRTNNEDLWNFMNTLVTFYPFINCPIAVYHNKVYNLPFNMNTFNALWGITSPADAKKKIESQIIPCSNATNLEDWALSQVGVDLYNTFIKDYTEKQWNKSCRDLPATIMRRLCVRYTYDNNYYDAKFQGVPLSYTELINKLLSSAEVKLGCDGKSVVDCAKTVVYTGPIDDFFDNCFGKLEYRSLEFRHVIKDTENFQGNAVVNFTDNSVKYLRAVEHRHFYSNVKSDKSVVSYEYPVTNGDPLYPIEDKRNKDLYEKYETLANETIPNVHFAGRLGKYAYYDMAETVTAAIDLVNMLINQEEKRA